MLVSQLTATQRQALDRYYYCKPSQLKGYLKTLRTPKAQQYLSDMLGSSYFDRLGDDKDFFILLLLYTSLTESQLTDAKNPGSTATGYFQILSDTRTEARRQAPWPLPEWGYTFASQFPYALSLFLQHNRKYKKEEKKPPSASIILPWSSDPVVNRFMNLRWWYGVHWGSHRWKPDPIYGVARTYSVLYANPKSLQALGATVRPSGQAAIQRNTLNPTAWESFNRLVGTALENITPFPTIQLAHAAEAEQMIGQPPEQVFQDADAAKSCEGEVDPSNPTAPLSQQILMAYPDMMKWDQDLGVYLMAPHIKEEFLRDAAPQVRDFITRLITRSKAKLLITSVLTSYADPQKPRGGNHAKGAVDFLPVITDAAGQPVRWTNSKGKAITPRFWANPLFVKFFAGFDSIAKAHNIRIGIETDHVHVDTAAPSGVYIYTTARPEHYANDAALVGHEPALISAPTYLQALKMAPKG